MSKNKQTKWIQLTLYKNCFNDGEAKHIGFKHDGTYYCLTHSKSKTLIPKKDLRMNHVSDEPEYLAVATSVPKPVNLTNMRISKLFFLNNVLKNKKCQELSSKNTQKAKPFQNIAEIQVEDALIVSVIDSIKT